MIGSDYILKYFYSEVHFPNRTETLLLDAVLLLAMKYFFSVAFVLLLSLNACPPLGINTCLIRSVSDISVVPQIFIAQRKLRSQRVAE